jgi:phosphatidylglycerophosphatase A
MWSQSRFLARTTTNSQTRQTRAMIPPTEPVTAPAGASSRAHKPRWAYVIATAFGIGYLKPAPGTWGSLFGLLVAIISHPLSWFFFYSGTAAFVFGANSRLFTNPYGLALLLIPSVAVWIILAILGMRAGTIVAQNAGIKDPQYVVIDEVSGVHLALILGLAPLMAPSTLLNTADANTFALYTGMSVLNWRYLLAAFVLFRFFDILKPFPCRRLEHLPGGWGIMADDWMAGVYAAICLRLALHFNLL